MNDKKKVDGTKRFPSEIDDPKERALNDLTLGRRKPENEDEQELQDDIDQIEKEGGTVAVPSAT